MISPYLRTPPRTLYAALRDYAAWHGVPFWQAVRMVSPKGWAQEDRR